MFEISTIADDYVVKGLHVRLQGIELAVRPDDLLLARRLNGIVFGMCKDEVLKVIGQPGDRLLQKSPEVLRYGSLELGFIGPTDEIGSRLATISLYFGRHDKPPLWLDTGEWPVSEITTVDQFRTYVETIGLRVHRSDTAEPYEYLITETGVRASFVNDQLRLIHAAEVSHAPTDARAKTICVLRRQFR